MITSAIKGPFALLVVYFGAQVCARVFASPGLELHEAEQALWTQDLALGSGTQPPLYTWVQWLVFKLFGVSIFSLSLLKNTLLASTYGFVWLAARRWLPPSLAVLAAASLLLIPQIGWESQRDLTHSVLAAAVAAATLYVLIRLIERPTPRLYLLLIPHGLWLLDHWDLASTRTMEKLGQTPLGGYGIVRGISSLVSATGATVGVLCLIYMLLFGWSVWKRHEGDHYDRQICSFWQQYFRALTALLLALVLFFGVMHFKGRWLQPLLFAVPFAFFCCRKKLVGHARLRWLKVVLSVLAALYLAVAAFRPSPEWMAGST
ncbi:hypothetical protein METUNv1_03091 [Methyloversatilis universalis FAM5]|uniref:Glycosyltransferase RgtA/B/C/D-like domain-containing protein n=1 Tax=Methyloversatilis universalis (strain ATCC BAA-1314 / DSM 25237 / JCM 13912 / CCUG 52030 / FAM5) TaxID=1000565 RepID=F5RFL0_METUF|nr:glycosyltransferase family 39 protein [Methyloversatilis universalis]EGK70866.1 hypothetical protein METUNv1_03091 [Methyloversatilis universalis FAM5]